MRLSRYYQAIYFSSTSFTDNIISSKIDQSTLGMYGGKSKLYKVRGTETDQSNAYIYGGLSKIFIIKIRIYLFSHFTDKVRGAKNEQSDVAMYGRRIHVNIYSRVRFEQSTVDTYGEIPKLYIMQIRFCAAGTLYMVQKL